LVYPFVAGYLLAWMAWFYFVTWVWVTVAVLNTIWLALTVAQAIVRHPGPAVDRLALASDVQARNHPETAYFGLLDRLVAGGVDLPRWITVYWVVFVSVSVSWYSGRIMGASQVEFLVSERAPKLVVLRTYGSNFVCAAYNEKQKAAERRFRVISIADTSYGSWTTQQIGPLRVKPAARAP
jgi:hypothetical protein